MLNFSKFRQTDSANPRGQGFKCWLLIFLLSILLPLSGCGLFGDDVIDSGVNIGSLGFVNEYALLDTVTRKFEFFTPPPPEFEWMNECEDVKWSSIGGLCLKSIPDTTGFVLLKNGVDTLAVRYNDADKINYLFFSGRGIVLNGPVYLMDNQGQVSENAKRFMW